MKENKIILLSAFLLILGIAFRSQAGQQNSELPQTHPKIAIKDSTITIGDTVVWMGGKFEDWERALPKGARCSAMRKGMKLCIWDELGLELGSDMADFERVEFIRITLKHRPQTLSRDENPWAPRGIFHGELEIDSFRIDADTEFRRIGQNTSRKRELTCGGHYCGRPYGLFNSVAQISFRLDSNHDRGRVTDFAISCESTVSCRKLIPNEN